MTIHQTIRLTALLGAFALITTGSFFLARAVSLSEPLQEHIFNLGYFGPFIIAFFGSLNAFVPIPPATFAPIFLAADMSHLSVVALFAIGASCADSVGYILGWLGRTYSNEHHPQAAAYLNNFFKTHQKWIIPVTYLYMAVIPLPNEYIMIPLALAGYRFRHLVFPLILGNLFYFTWTIFGYNSLFNLWF